MLEMFIVNKINCIAGESATEVHSNGLVFVMNVHLLLLFLRSTFLWQPNYWMKVQISLKKAAIA